MKNRMIALICGFLGVLCLYIGIKQFMLAQGVVDLYKDFGTDIPQGVSLSPFIALVPGFVFLYYAYTFFRKKN